MNSRTIKLNEPDRTRGLPVMQALAVRASVNDWSAEELSLQDLSDLLWAAFGFNRPDLGKRTAPSALNSQDIDLYVFRRDAVYLYDAQSHTLKEVVSGDYRSLFFPPLSSIPGAAGKLPISSPQPPGEQTMPPVIILLVSDLSRFPFGDDNFRTEVSLIDTGLVSENISIFCAAVGLGTRPRGNMEREKIRVLLRLKETQFPRLNHPVGYKKS